MDSRVYLFLVLLTTGGASSDCRHEWQAHFSECPFGRSILSVTLPDPGKASKKWSLKYQNSWSHPLPALYAVDAADLNQGWLLFVIYGYVPYVVVLLAFLPMLRGSTGTRELSFVLFAITLFVVTEIALKNIARQPRPERSCVTSCGMPSGISSLAMGYWTCLILDLAFRVHPEKEERKLGLWDGCTISCGKLLVACKRSLWKMNTFTPLAANADIPHIEFLTTSSIWSLVLLPVPLSRIGNYDHSPMQVMAGCVVGVVCGLAWTAMARRLQYKFFAHTGRVFSWRCFEIKHNFSLPFFVAEDIIKDALENGSYDEGKPLVEFYHGIKLPEEPELDESESGGGETVGSYSHSSTARESEMQRVLRPQMSAHVVFIVTSCPYRDLYLCGSIKELGGSVAMNEKAIKLSRQTGTKVSTLSGTIKSHSVQVSLPVEDVEFRLYREDEKKGVMESAWRDDRNDTSVKLAKRLSSFLEDNKHEVYLKVTIAFGDKKNEGARVEHDGERQCGQACT